MRLQRRHRLEFVSEQPLTAMDLRNIGAELEELGYGEGTTVVPIMHDKGTQRDPDMKLMGIRVDVEIP